MNTTAVETQVLACSTGSLSLSSLAHICSLQNVGHEGNTRTTNAESCNIGLKYFSSVLTKDRYEDLQVRRLVLL